MITFRGSQVQDTFWPLVEFVSGSPWFNFSAALVNSQLAYLRPLGILSSCCVMFLLFDSRDCVHWTWKATMGSRQLNTCVCVYVYVFSNWCPFFLMFLIFRILVEVLQEKIQYIHVYVLWQMMNCCKVHLTTSLLLIHPHKVRKLVFNLSRIRLTQACT